MRPLKMMRGKKEKTTRNTFWLDEVLYGQHKALIPGSVTTYNAWKTFLWAVSSILCVLEQLFGQ